MKVDFNSKIDEKIHEISNFYIENFNPTESNLSLFNGLGGIALFFFEKINSDLYRENDRAFFLKVFEIIYDKLNDDDYPLTYCDGLTGIAIFIRLCRDYLEYNNYDIDELLSDLDDVIFESINYSDVLYNPDSLDFLHGKLGVLHYLLTFNVRPNLTEKFYDKVTISLIQHLQTAQKEDRPINFGLAHGMCSYAHIIMRGNDLFPDKNNAILLLRLIEKIYLDTDINFSNSSLYPSISNKKDFEKNSSFFQPLGWCYGDQTISTSLFKLGVFLDSKKLIDHSINISNHWKKRDNIIKALGSSEYYDFSFCHGVTSVAFFNKKWYDITNDPKFLENYIYFMELIISQVQENDNIAGYKKCTGDDTLYKKDWGLLTGSAGIGLNLIYQRNNENNKWLKLFLYE